MQILSTLTVGLSTLRAITDAINIVVDPEVSCSEKVLYASDADRRFTNFVKALDATVQAHHALGEALQWHVDNQLPSVPLLRDASWEEWRTTVRCLLSSDQFSGALNAVRIATDLAAKQHNPYVTIQKTGAPKDYKVRGVVNELLSIFEAATGIRPKVYATHHTDDGYAGNFYKFAVACLAPIHLVPPKQLGSAIHVAYKEWNRRLSRRTKVKTPRY